MISCLPKHESLVRFGSARTVLQPSVPISSGWMRAPAPALSGTSRSSLHCKWGISLQPCPPFFSLLLRPSWHSERTGHMARRLAWRGQNRSTWEQRRAEGWAEHRSGVPQELFTIGERFNALAKTPYCSFILRPAHGLRMCVTQHAAKRLISYSWSLTDFISIHSRIHSPLIAFRAAFKDGRLFTVYCVHEKKGMLVWDAFQKSEFPESRKLSENMDIYQCTQRRLICSRCLA